MTSTHDTIIAKVTTPHVFRHTPFEHETTTAVLVNTYTAIEPVNVAVVQNLDHNVRLIPVEPNHGTFIG